jgi:uncharacterized phage-like protein YoqJ
MDMPTDPHRAHGVCFTGHRPNQLHRIRLEDLRLDLSAAIVEAIDRGFDTFYCGMAQGSDILAGELTVSLRQQYPWIRLIAVVPFPEQTDGWSPEWTRRYSMLLQKADEVRILLPQMKRGGYFLRDRYMVDRASLLIGIYAGTPRGGTAYTLRYAQQQGLELKLLTPQDYR